MATNDGGGSEWLRWTPNGGCGFEWSRLASMDGHKWYNTREDEREEFDEHFVTLSLLRIMASFDSMSSWYSAGSSWSDSFDSKSGRRRGSWSGKSEVHSEDEWFSQKCSTGNR